MRLIDANKMIKGIKENYVIYGYADFLNDFFRMVEEQPTVEAIPIEWIKEWVNNYCDWSQEKLIECLLRTWSKMGEVEE